MSDRDRSNHEGADRSARDAPVPRYADRGDGWTLAMELLTATFLWGGIGWLIDRWLGTAPVAMAVGFVLGNALGIYLIWIRSQDRFTREHAELMARRSRTIPADELALMPRGDSTVRSSDGEPHDERAVEPVDDGDRP